MNLHKLIFYLSLEKPVKGPRIPNPGYFCFTDVEITRTTTEKDFDGQFSNYHCKFPFTYQGKEHRHCIKESHDKVWCATEDVLGEPDDSGYECKTCWKNETYKWANCMFGPCMTEHEKCGPRNEHCCGIVIGELSI